MFVLGAAIGGASNGDARNTAASTATTTATATATVTNASTVTVTPTKVVATKTVQIRVTFTPSPVARTSDGQYLVGREIKPGTWHTDDSNCYYARLNSLNGSLGAIIANDNTGPATIEIRSSDKAVKFSGGCEWKKIG